MDADVKYGDTFYLEVWGYASDTVGENIKGYLALHAPVAARTTFTAPLLAVTTLTPVATWKFESPDSKTGPVCIGHTVRIVYAGAEPASTDQLPTPSYLQGTEGDAGSIKAVHDVLNPGRTPDKSLEWDIYTGAKGVYQMQPSGPVTYGLYIMLSCSLTPAQSYTDGENKPNATGAFLVARDPRNGASGTVKEIIDYVGTRKIGNAYKGADTWWKPVKITTQST